MNRQPTIKDVAALSQVSLATVTRVIHGNGPVAAETRQRVEEAIRQTGYRVNHVARDLRRNDTRTIGHILHAITQNPFFAEVALGVEDEARTHGHNVFIYNVQANPKREAEGVKTFLDRRVSSMIFTTAADPANVLQAVEAGLPVVQVERRAAVGAHTVLVDNYIGARQAMKHLLDLGHRRIGYIGGDPGRSDARVSGELTVEEQRITGWRDGLRDAGLSAEGGLLRVGPYLSFEHDAFGGEGAKAMNDLLDGGARPTAVLVGSDILAAGALQALYERSLHVPRDISLIGFDDTLAAHLTPELSTVALPMRDIGRAAVRLALETHLPGRFKTVTLSSHLHLRRSTAPA